jgi:hypothetical protein
MTDNLMDLSTRQKRFDWRGIEVFRARNKQG